MLDVLVRAVDVVAQERATIAALAKIPAPHEVIDDELAVLAEQIGECLLAGWRVEHVLIVDFHPRQRAPFGSDEIVHARERFLALEMSLARLDPLFAGDDAMRRIAIGTEHGDLRGAL